MDAIKTHANITGPSEEVLAKARDAAPELAAALSDLFFTFGHGSHAPEIQRARALLIRIGYVADLIPKFIGA